MKRILMNGCAMACALLSIAAAQDWQPARPGFTYAFPRDHGQHPDHKIEWWYYTGNVYTAAGRRFGYQLTFFRIGAVAKPALESKWALRDVWMAHFAISDLDAKRYLNADRLNRAGPELAGATEERVWNEDWSMTNGSEMHLRAADRAMAIDLKLAGGKPVVIHGQDGISQKGATPGNATHYYSLTRMPTTGTITVGNESFDVTGESWMDHETGTSFLEKGTEGWDWFSAQLSDGSELMLFQLRSVAASDGRGRGAPSHNAGTIIRPDGRTVPLAAADFQIKPIPGAEWPSPTGAKYPQQWEISIPAHDITLTCRSPMPNQEFRADSNPGLSYWEGAVDYTGTIREQPVKGHGYLEMTGYSGKAMSVWFGD